MYTYIYINYLLSGMHIQVLALLPKVPLDPYREVVAFGDVWPNIQIYRCANDPIRQTSTCWPCFQTRIFSNWWFQPPWKNISQIGSSSQLLGKIQNVPNHQPVYYMFVIIVISSQDHHLLWSACELCISSTSSTRRWRQHETMKPWTLVPKIDMSYPMV